MDSYPFTFVLLQRMKGCSSDAIEDTETATTCRCKQSAIPSMGARGTDAAKSIPVSTQQDTIHRMRDRPAALLRRVVYPH